MSAAITHLAIRAPEDASDEALVEAVIVLTHRIHALSDVGEPNAKAELREQREMAKTEILRRMERN